MKLGLAFVGFRNMCPINPECLSLISSASFLSATVVYGLCSLVVGLEYLVWAVVYEYLYFFDDIVGKSPSFSFVR